jgi:cytochrome c-type biogenesis protein CcmH/NrfG
MTQAPLAGTRASAPANLGTAGNEPPLKDVLVELWQNLEKLLRQEVALATAEIDLKAQKLKGEVTGVAIGGALMLAGALALVAALILILALVMPAWAASLITGAVAAGAGFGLVKAKTPSADDVKPDRTIQNLKKDLQTFTESTK